MNYAPFSPWSAQTLAPQIISKETNLTPSPRVPALFQTCHCKDMMEFKWDHLKWSHDLLRAVLSIATSLSEIYSAARDKFRLTLMCVINKEPWR